MTGLDKIQKAVRTNCILRLLIVVTIVLWLPPTNESECDGFRVCSLLELWYLPGQLFTMVPDQIQTNVITMINPGTRVGDSVAMNWMRRSQSQAFKTPLPEPELES